MTGSPDRTAAVFAVLGDAAQVRLDFSQVVVDVPVTAWAGAATIAREQLGLTYFDFLTAVDEQPAGFRLVCHLAGRVDSGLTHIVLRTLVDAEAPSIAHVFAGARWHERETAEMFGLTFVSARGEPLVLEPLLLPEGFGAHPLRKDFVLASRVAKAWPGGKEPGESDATAAPSRRRTRPPGVPEGWADD